MLAQSMLVALLTFAQAAAAPVASTVPVEAAPSTAPPKPVIICYREETTGTRMGSRRVCREVSGTGEEARRAQAEVDRLRQKLNINRAPKN